MEHVTLGGLRRAVFEGDMERGSVMAGQVAGMLHEIKPLRQIFEELYTGSQAVLKATEAAWQYQSRERPSPSPLYSGAWPWASGGTALPGR